MSDKLQISDEAGINAALATARKAGEANDFVVVDLQEGTKNVVKLAATGPGGLGAFQAACPPTMPAWGIVRLTEQEKKSETEEFTVQKIVFIQWLPEGVPMMIKANLGVLKGQIKRIFEPAHIEVLFDTADDFNEAAIRERLRDAAGTSDKTRKMDFDREDTPVVGGVPLGGTGQQQGAKPKPVFSPIKTSGMVKYADLEAIQAAINDVRADNTPTDWALIGFVAGTKDTLELRGSGAGGADELAALFKDNEVMYSITKVTDQIDVSTTTKYVVVHWLGPNTPIMHKAKVGTLKGEVDALIGNRQIVIDASETSQVSSAIFADLVGKTSGSKSLVRD